MSDPFSTAAGGKAPYVGARPLEERELLFGRDPDVDALAELLRTDRIVVLHSPSGAGKSSLINAKLVPRLRKEKFGTVTPIRVGGPELMPAYSGGRFLGNLLAQLTPAGPSRNELAQLDGAVAADRISTALYAGSGPFPVLIFDQFEEVVTTDRSDTAIEEFFDRLGAILENRHIWALFAIREDYLGAIEPYVHYIPGALRRRHRLDLLTHDEAVEAISGPAAALQQARRASNPSARSPVYGDGAAVELARRLRLRRDARQNALVEGRYVEPVLLQVVCTDLWQHLPADAEFIRVEDLPNEDRLSLALAHFYDGVLDQAVTSEVSEEQIRSWVTTRLVAGRLRAQTREGPTGTAADAPVLDKLVGGYLLRRDVRNDVAWYELVHDRMVAGVYESEEQRQPTLSPEKRILSKRAKEWVDQHRNPFLLLRGDELSAVQKRQPDLTKLSPNEREYVQASTWERKRRRAERWLTAVAIIGVLVGMVAGFWGLRRQSTAKRDVLEANRRVSDATQEALAVRNQSMADAAEMRRRARLAEAEANIARGDANTNLRLAQQRATEAAAARQYADSARATATELLTTNTATRAELARQRAELTAEIKKGQDENLKTQKDLQTRNDQTTVRDATVTAVQRLSDEPGSGATRVIAAARKALQQSEVVDTYALQSLPELLQASLHFMTLKHEAGGGVAVAGVEGAGTRAADLTVRVLTGAGQELTYLLTGNSSTAPTAPACRLHYMCADAKGKGEPQVVGCTATPSCKVWLPPTTVALAGLSTTAVGYYAGNVVVVHSNSDRVVPVKTHKHPALHLALRDDGLQLASASALWSFAVSQATDPAQRLFRKPSVFRWIQIVLRGGTSDMISAIAYLHTRENLLAIGFDDGRLEVWDVLMRRPVMRLRAHMAAVLSIASNRLGSQLVTSSRDGTARVWDVPASLSPDGLPSRREATAVFDQKPARRLGPHRGDVTAAAFSQDGTMAVTAGADSQLQVWDLEAGEKLAEFSGHRGRVAAVQFVRADLVASTSDDGTTRLWRVLDRARMQDIHKVSEELSSEAGALAQGLAGDTYARVEDPVAKARLLGLLDRAEALTAQPQSRGSSLPARPNQ